MSNETKWTPGPWEYRPGEDNEGGSNNAAGSIYAPESRGGNFIARVWEDGPSPEADGALLAAAPALYEALEEFASQDGCDCGHPACKRCARTRDARTVLAAARGETKGEDR